ncbi:hypothetical protein GGQ00_003328 [Salinibacter ruber]|uniref:nucleotidyltransferase domain-containing protein n=1 Tax=Salinibacter ruber TaxID=146919 RepID=UPI0021677087|nr:nucleotidyltransferase domain-containing protein [Salinibacter ruber]MCS4044865.1 hypothetical protein [Salinibacter ruber]
MPDPAVSIPTGLQETLRWVTATLREVYGPRLKRLLLFGSQARGDAKADSDVDLLVVLGGPVRLYEEAKRTGRIATRIAADRGTVLSFIHMSEETFADDRRPLVRSVNEEGIDLLDAFSESRDGSARPLSAESASGAESDPVSSPPD